MRNFRIPFLLTACLFGLVLSACSSSESGLDTAAVDLSFSDAAVDDASAVVITVERITFQRNGDESDESDESAGSAEDIVVETFASDDDGGDTETFTLDLLTVQGEDSRLVIDSVELPVGEYSNMLIQVVPDEENANYVVDASGTKQLKVPSNVLKLGAFTIEPTSKQSLVVEFGLQQSMTYNPGPDRYILKPRGVRIVAVDQAALVTGNVDHAALQVNEACSALELGGTAGNIYLYAGHGIDPTTLGDNFDESIAANEDGLIAPFASSSLMNDSFSLSYLESGDYTLAVSCNETADDADLIEGLSVPNPADQVIEISIVEGQTLSCDIPLTENGCL